MLYKDGVARIGDFGLSVLAAGENQEFLSARGGLINFLALELFQVEAIPFQDSRTTFESDVYSFGCIIYHVRPCCNLAFTAYSYRHPL